MQHSTAHVKLNTAIDQLEYQSKKKKTGCGQQNKLGPSNRDWDLHQSPTTFNLNVLADV